MLFIFVSLFGNGKVNAGVPFWNLSPSIKSGKSPFFGMKKVYAGVTESLFWNEQSMPESLFLGMKKSMPESLF